MICSEKNGRKISGRLYTESVELGIQLDDVSIASSRLAVRSTFFDSAISQHPDQLHDLANEDGASPSDVLVEEVEAGLDSGLSGDQPTSAGRQRAATRNKEGQQKGWMPQMCGEVRSAPTSELSLSSRDPGVFRTGTNCGRKPS